MSLKLQQTAVFFIHGSARFKKAESGPVIAGPLCVSHVVFGARPREESEPRGSSS